MQNAALNDGIVRVSDLFGDFRNRGDARGLISAGWIQGDHEAWAITQTPSRHSGRRPRCKLPLMIPPRYRSQGNERHFVTRGPALLSLGPV